MNDEAENLQVLPPVDESIGDKLIIFKTCKRPMPMPTKTDAERALFWETMVNELPAFLHWLSEWEIPAELRDDRYGIVHYHHPEILLALNELAPEARLLDLIDDEFFLMGGGQRVYGPWKGPARDLEKKLVDAEFADARDARRLLTYNTACGCYLARLEQKYPERISSKTKKGTRIYTIQPPEPELPEGPDEAND